MIFEDQNFEVINGGNKTLITAPNGKKLEVYGDKESWFETFKYWALKEIKK